MPLKKFKPRSPDPYVGRIKGDTEYARFAHLNELSRSYENFTPENIIFGYNDSTVNQWHAVGDWVEFTKDDYGDQVDVIIPGQLEITRGEEKGIFNIAVEEEYVQYSSPADTEWNSQYTDGTLNGWGDLTNITSRNYDHWRDSVDANPPGAVDDNLELIMHHTPSDRYFQIKFLQWTEDGGGGFSYERREIVYGPVTVQVAGGIFFADGSFQDTAGGSGGDVIPDDVYSIVEDGGNFIINDGDTTFTLPSAFQGWKVRVFRNNTLLDFTDMNGDSYYTQDTETNTITLSVAAVTDEKIVIQAYKKV